MSGWLRKTVKALLDVAGVTVTRSVRLKKPGLARYVARTRCFDDALGDSHAVALPTPSDQVEWVGADVVEGPLSPAPKPLPRH